jgi:hypothetical protein
MHTILYSRKNNENWPTPTYPVAVWCGQVDLEATGVFCRSFDDDGLVSAKLYELREVTLPAWLSPEEWIGGMVQWKYTWACVPFEAPELVQRAFFALSFEEQFLLGRLLNARPKASEGFLASLREQTWAWILGERTHARPLSNRQLSALNRRPWEVRQASERLYRDRVYAPPAGARVVTPAPAAAPVAAPEGA